MLIEFRVENHRSLRDEQVLTFEAANIGDPADPRPRQVPGHDKKILPVAALYGANASGKSNVLSAFEFMKSAVEYSHRYWDPEKGIPRDQFAWGNKTNHPSIFELTLVDEGVRYQYGFVVNDLVVEEEWLFAWPNDRKQVWFERDKQQFKFGTHLAGPNETVQSVTRSNALFLSTAIQNNHLQLFKFYVAFARSKFAKHDKRSIDFHQLLSLLSNSKNMLGKAAVPASSGDDSTERTIRNIKSILEKADLGICDVKIELENSKIYFKHQKENDFSWLELADESRGTQTLFKIAFPAFYALELGGVLIADELESSLHPSLALAIVQLFNDPKTNPHNAQLLFTTHDTNLLNSLGSDLEEPPLRRDQIWFTEKDKEGATKLYPLTDYKPRKAENLERGYLQGRYGAIPYLGSFSGLME